MQVTPALRGEGFFIGESFGIRCFPTPNNFQKEKAAVLVVSDFLSTSERNDDLMQHLALAGYGCYGIHAPGLGESRGQFSLSTLNNLYRSYAEFICKIHGESKLHVIGEGLGGALSLGLSDIALSCTVIDGLTSSTALPTYVAALEEDMKRSPSNYLESSKDSLTSDAQALIDKSKKSFANSPSPKVLVLHNQANDLITADQSRNLIEELPESTEYLELSYKDHQGRSKLLSCIAKFLG